MFSTCLFCHASLGANESIEHFPVGRRLAYDAERGRLWVVCRKCARWNLTPLEERWEALEECERAYRGTRTRVSTDNIALARLRDGTDLVRIGSPLMPELATWRYGDQLRGRRRAYVTTAIGAGAALLVGTAALGFAFPAVSATGFLGVFTMGAESLLKQQRMRRAIVSLPADEGVTRTVARKHADSTQLLISSENQLALSVDCLVRRPRSIRSEKGKLKLQGAEAGRFLSTVIVHVNKSGASQVEVANAVRELSERPSPEALLRYASSRVEDGLPASGGMVRFMPTRLRLAIEMSLHSEDERRAMSGELGALYARWEEAERIAKIADGALSPLSSR